MTLGSDSSARILSMGIATAGGPAALTVAKCTASCGAAGYSYAGVEYSGECCKQIHIRYRDLIY
jgi:WSC domain